MKEWPDFEVIRADKISRPGMIDAQVIQHLLDAELVIADLSTLNANAFYEIGIRHMAQKPVIHMQLAEDDIPFDVSLYRAIKFSRRTPLDLRKARDELGIVVKSVLADDYEVDNPVTRARGKIELEARATPNEKVLIDQLSDIERRLEEVERVRVSRSREPNPPKRRIVRIGFEPEHFDEKAQQQAKDILSTILGAEDFEIINSRLWAWAPRETVTDKVAWESAKKRLLAVSGLVSVENSYEKFAR